MSMKSVCDMGCGEMHKFALVLDKAGFNADLVQKIVNSRGNKDAETMYTALTGAENAVVNRYLKRLSGDRPIIIPACDGSEILANARDVFKSDIDPDFKKWGLDKKGKPTEETAVAVYEIVQDCNFAQMFSYPGADLTNQCLTQHQIEAFCKNHSNWFYFDGYGTFFLTKKDWEKSANFDNLFVASAYVRSDDLNVYAFRFEDGNVWNADRHHRLVVPRLGT